MRATYSNENIIITTLDSTVDAVDKAITLYKDAVEELYVESHPQYTYTDEIGNIYGNTNHMLMKNKKELRIKEQIERNKKLPNQIWERLIPSRENLNEEKNDSKSKNEKELEENAAKYVRNFSFENHFKNLLIIYKKVLQK